MSAHPRKPAPWCRLLFLLLAPFCAQAIISPTLQPGHLFDRYSEVLELTLTAVDVGKRTATLQVTQVIKGAFVPKTVTVMAVGDGDDMAIDSLAQIGAKVVAYVGESRLPNSIRLYTGGSGQWQICEKNAKDQSSWQWTQRIDPLGDGGGMSGTASPSPSTHRPDESRIP